MIFLNALKLKFSALFIAYNMPMNRNLIVITLFISSCIIDCEDKRYDKYELVDAGSIKIEIDSSTSYSSGLFSVFNTDTMEYLVVENEYKNSIQFYSLETLKKVHEIVIDRTGKNGVNKLRGFTVISLDSILVYDKLTLYNVLLVDKKSKVLDRINMTSNMSSGASLMNHSSITRSPDIYYRNKIYFFVYPNIKKEKMKFEYVFDLHTKEQRFMDNIMQPEIYSGKLWGSVHNLASRIKGPKDLFIYSWAIDPYIRVTNFTTVDTMYLAKSNYISEIKPYNGTDNYMKYFIETPLYGSIIWDKYRKVYYRFAHSGIPYTSPDTGLPQSDENKVTSIIILDEDFEVIGETLLQPTYKYFVRDWFLSKEGLFISNSHFENPEINEGYMSFSKLDLQIKK